MSRLTTTACAIALTCAPFGIATAHASNTLDNTVAIGAITAETSPPFTDPFAGLQNEPDECLNSNPRPNCGVKPQQSGDRGGWMQYVVMGTMLGALAVIGTVIVRNIIKRDRAIAQEMAESDQ